MNIQQGFIVIVILEIYFIKEKINLVKLLQICDILFFEVVLLGYYVVIKDVLQLGYFFCLN